MTTSDTLGATARQAVIDIFRKKDATAVDRYFGEPSIQHDPNLADGLAGMRSFAAEVARSPAADITIYRTLVDGDLVLLHSRYEGVARYAGPAIAQSVTPSGGGSIINISSILGKVGMAGAAAYCASKGGVALLTKAAALEWAPLGIRVNSVHPGFIDTPMVSGALPVVGHAPRFLRDQLLLLQRGYTEHG